MNHGEKVREIERIADRTEGFVDELRAMTDPKGEGIGNIARLAMGLHLMSHDLLDVWQPTRFVAQIDDPLPSLFVAWRDALDEIERDGVNADAETRAREVELREKILAAPVGSPGGAVALLMFAVRSGIVLQSHAATAPSRDILGPVLAALMKMFPPETAP